jgi:hypothetical protein
VTSILLCLQTAPAALACRRRHPPRTPSTSPGTTPSTATDAQTTTQPLLEKKDGCSLQKYLWFTRHLSSLQGDKRRVVALLLPETRAFLLLL